MGLSENIVAAMIGAAATMSAALFQLLRAKRENDPKPRRSRVRSIVATLALMVASAVGGYGFAELRAAGAREDIALLRAELKGQLGALASSTAQIAANADPRRSQAVTTAATALAAEADAVEAVARLPQCPRSSTDADGPALPCDRAALARVELCVEVPAGAERASLELYARRNDSPWIVVAGPDSAPDPARAVAVERGPASYASATGELTCVVLANHDVDAERFARLVVRLRSKASLTT